MAIPWFVHLYAKPHAKASGSAPYTDKQNHGITITYETHLHIIIILSDIGHTYNSNKS